MKDIFDIINPPQKPQVENQEEPPKEKKEQKPGIVVGEIQKPFMEKLIENGKQDLSEFVVAPKKSFLSHAKIKKQFVEKIKQINLGGYEDFVDCIKLAKHKKINLTKIKIEIRYLSQYYTLNPLEYVLYMFRYNTIDMAKAVKYLIANEPRFSKQEILNDCIYMFLQFDTDMGRRKIELCSKDFLEVYKILLDCGAKNPDISGLLFWDSSCKKLINENYDLIELMLYSNNPDINKNLLNAFYTCENPELFYPILKRYGIKPDLNTAIAKLKHENAQQVLKYLVDVGVFDKSELTEQRIRDAIVEHKVCGIVTASGVILKAREVRDGTREEIEAKQKLVEQEQIKIQQEKRAQIQKQQIDQVFENAVKNTEITM